MHLSISVFISSGSLSDRNEFYEFLCFASLQENSTWLFRLTETYPLKMASLKK